MDLDEYLGGPAQRVVLSDVLDRLRPDDATLISSGGSSATVLRLKCKTDLVAVKLLAGNLPDWVDGHDLTAFRLKTLHHRWLSDHGGRVSKLYPKILAERNGADWSWVATRWYDGFSLIDNMTTDATEWSMFATRLQRVIDFLTASAYSLTATPAIFQDAASVYLSRVKQRLEYLARIGLRSLVHAKEFVFNDQRYSSPFTIMREIEEQPILQGVVCPKRLYFPVHGDLNLRNLLISSLFDKADDADLDRHIQLFDPRPGIDQWDIMYDIGKMCFSLSLYEALLDCSFGVQYCVNQDIVCGEVSIQKGRITQIELGLRNLSAALDRAHVFRTLMNADEPFWQGRLCFVHACHILAESACRISANSGKLTKLSRDAQVEQATALFLLGSFLLNQWHQIASARQCQRLDDVTSGLLDFFSFRSEDSREFVRSS